ncbi:DUF4244 domain-containing protein [Nonomuraea sp. B10E15]|uniref:DUF4244 domain-containing protein n=1 Tax=Nonomuraea sp. B10E15 TaxID=3153560 RepID=UPI00325CC78A
MSTSFPPANPSSSASAVSGRSHATLGDSSPSARALPGDLPVSAFSGTARGDAPAPVSPDPSTSPTLVRAPSALQPRPADTAPGNSPAPSVREAAGARPRWRSNRWLHHALANRERGMSTAEYAVGTIAACAFAALLFKVVSSSEVQEMLTSLIDRALKTTGK